MQMPLPNASKKTRINYPIEFDLKIFIQTINTLESNIEFIREILNKLQIPFSNISTKSSSTGKYISYTTCVKIDTETIFNRLYSELKTIPYIKAAI